MSNKNINKTKISKKSTIKNPNRKNKKNTSIRNISSRQINKANKRSLTKKTKTLSRKSKTKKFANLVKDQDKNKSKNIKRASNVTEENSYLTEKEIQLITQVANEEHEHPPQMTIVQRPLTGGATRYVDEHRYADSVADFLSRGDDAVEWSELCNSASLHLAATSASGARTPSRQLHLFAECSRRATVRQLALQPPTRLDALPRTRLAGQASLRERFMAPPRNATPAFVFFAAKERFLDRHASSRYGGRPVSALDDAALRRRWATMTVHQRTEFTDKASEDAKRFKDQRKHYKEYCINKAMQMRLGE